MKTLPASEAEHNFAHLLAISHNGPVMIEQNGEAVAVMMSMEDFKRFDPCDDDYWIAKAEEGEASGYLGAEESEALLQRLMNAPD